MGTNGTQQQVQFNKRRQRLQFIAGISFTIGVATVGYGLATLPVFQMIGPMATSILLAILYRHFFDYPLQLKSGIQYTAKTLLRVAIVLYGLKLNMQLIFQEGIGLLFKGAFVIIFSILIMLLIAKWLKADTSLSFLIGIGTGICGAAAIAAVSPIVKAKEEDTALSVGIIALIGTLFSVFYTFIRTSLPLTDQAYGMWSGISLHELAHVALAAAPAGEDALALALLTKLGRVFLLIPVCIILMFWMKRKNKEKTGGKVPFPLFLIGFLIMSFVNSYLIGDWVAVPEKWLEATSFFATFLLTMAMVGLGVNIDLRQLRVKAIRPLIAVVITSLLLSVGTLFLV